MRKSAYARRRDLQAPAKRELPWYLDDESAAGRDPAGEHRHCQLRLACRGQVLQDEDRDYEVVVLRRQGS